MTFWRKKEKAAVASLKEAVQQVERDKEAARLNLERSMKKLKKQVSFEDRIMEIFGEQQ